MPRFLCVFASVAIVALFAAAADKPPAGSKAAAERDALHCPRGGLYPVCRRVPVTKKKPHVEYDIKCEPVCVPGCSLLASCRDGCGCEHVRIRDKKTLLKKVTQQEVSSYEYKIVWVCGACAFGGCCGGPLARDERGRPVEPARQHDHGRQCEDPGQRDVPHGLRLDP
jgi:hypothetical protein